MRVLFLLTQSLDYPSGLGRYWPLARHMARLGYEVEIAALHPAWSSLQPKRFVRDGVTVSYVGQMHVRQEGNRRRYYGTPALLAVTARATAALARVAIRRRVDAIHVAKAQPMNGLAGWLGARTRRLSWFLDCDDYEAASNRFAAAWQTKVVRWWEDRLPTSVRGVTTNTTFMRERCVRLGVPAERVLLIPNGFDPDRFAPVSPHEKEMVRQRWGLDGRRIVLYVGSLSLSSHPLGLLIDAFARVRQQMPSTTLLLVGGGEDYDTLAQIVRERELQHAVVMTGRVDPAQVPSFYAASHLLVDPVFDDDVARSRSPLKVVESLAMGVPVVTGDVGDRADALDHGRAGVLVRPGCAEALAEGIVSALEDGARYESMSEQAREASQRFRWDDLVREFVQVYEIA